MFWLTPVHIGEKSVILSGERFILAEELVNSFRMKINKNIHARLLSMIKSSMLLQDTTSLPLFARQGDIELGEGALLPISRFGDQFFTSLLTPQESLQFVMDRSDRVELAEEELNLLNQMMEHWGTSKCVVLIED